MMRSVTKPQAPITIMPVMTRSVRDSVRPSITTEPRPVGTPVISPTTIRIQAKPCATRNPLKIAGSDAGSTICRNIRVPEQPSIEAAAHAIAADRTGPMGTMEATDDIDTQGYWTTDDFEALLGLAAYRFIASTLGETEEASWAAGQYTSLLAATDAVLGQTIGQNHLDYLPC